MLISLDTETTGLDLRKGCKPFLVTICNEDLENTYWEWEVDPVTRQPLVNNSDLEEIMEYVQEADKITMHHAKFDVAALSQLDKYIGEDWPWHKTVDTQLDAHLIASNQPKDLTTLAIVHLKTNLQPYEDTVERACKDARTVVSREFPNWRIAEKGDPLLPSAKQKLWKFDMWLPAALARERGRDKSHEWFSVTADYANADSLASLALRIKFDKIIEQRGLRKISEERHKVIPVAFKMESTGITYNQKEANELRDRYKEESTELGELCESYARLDGYDLKLPKSGNNNSLLEYAQAEDGLNVRALIPKNPQKRKGFIGKTGNASLASKNIDHYILELFDREGRRCKQVKFLQSLKDKRSRDTAINYLERYEKFAVDTGAKNHKRLFPSLNITGTDTIRWSSSNPNEQNISDKEGFSLREAFGPLPGYEWWSCDASNIELRIPAYLSGEQAMIDLFERADEPPFFGSNHLLFFSLLHEDKYDHDDPEGLLKAKKKYKSTWYQWTKNGDFAIQYGAGETTADAAYRIKGAYRKIKKRFKDLSRYNQECVNYAQHYGYIETVPDKTVDKSKGYPLYCEKNYWGKVKPTLPLNYKVQGTAMWWMMKAMIRVQKYLDKINRDREPDQHFHIIMQVHDELVFCCPRSKNKKRKDGTRYKSNLPIIRKAVKLMEKGGNDIGIPTPVNIEYHPSNWGNSEKYEGF